MTYEEARAFLYDLPRFTGEVSEGELGLGRITALLEAVGRPQDAFRSVHVAGTNGKGSTASLLAAVATASGRRTGLHTSPHLVELTERMRVDGTPAPEDWVAGAVSRYEQTLASITPSFFEATVALSFLYFAECEVDEAIVEVGLGGRLDATNVIQPAVSIVTHVARDHTEVLGETLPEIAREKGGIIKSGTPLLVGPNAEEVTTVLRAMAEERGAPFHYVPEEVQVLDRRLRFDVSEIDVRTPVRTYRDLKVGLAGTHQQENALVALRAAEELLVEVREDPAPAHRGLAEVRRLAGLRGRLEVLDSDPTVVVDVAHNPAGVQAALNAVAPAIRRRGGRLYVILALMRDKDVEGVADLLTQPFITVLPTVVEAPRALPADRLHAVLKAAGVQVEAAASVSQQLDRFRTTAAPEDVLLVLGSHWLAAEVALQHRESGRAKGVI